MGDVIVTVTCNPAVDVTYEVDEHTVDAVHRVQRVRERPGGKGVNVATVLTQLGERVVATGLADTMFGKLLADEGVPNEFVPALPAVRRTTVVQAPGSTTSFWEPGHPPADPAAAVEQLTETVARLLPDAAVLVVSGSLPPGIPAEIPVLLAQRAHSVGVPAVLDVDGAALACAIERGQAVLVPNRAELNGLGRTDPDAAVVELARRTGCAAVATLGPDGLVASDGQSRWRAAPPRPLTGNATGAGDATTAAVARGLVTGTPWPGILADAVALSAAAVVTPVAGRIDLETYRRWSTEVDVRAEGA